MRVEDLNNMGKIFFLAFYSVSTAMTFTTEACQEIFEIHSGLLKWDSENVLYLLKC